jgi:aryl-alcohol dehydrogenase-like predicted oxidoreductase
MEYRRFGTTDLNVSVVGFGAWGIGGPAMVGSTPIGWGDVDDAVSIHALRRAKELGINFYDTADFYGLGHSEELIGSIFGNSPEVIIATKVGHRATQEQTITLDYSKRHIIDACEKSLKRLRRDVIDLYQLHSAKLLHLQQDECIETMEELKRQGKIRYWGLSLNTFKPFPESDFLIERKRADGFQLVYNIINQRAESVIAKSKENGYGVIARMPLQFGVLTGNVHADSKFSLNDHRSFRLTKEILETSLRGLQYVWKIADEKGISKTTLAMSFCAAHAGVSTVIPGIKTPTQAEMNSVVVPLNSSEVNMIRNAYKEYFTAVVMMMEKQG